MKLCKFVFLTVGLFAANAHAAPGKFLDILKKQGSDLQIKARSNQSQVTNQCTDFSGKWVGTCTSPEGEVEEREMNILQEDCYGFEESGWQIPIGGSLTMDIKPHPFAEAGFLIHSQFLTNGTTLKHD